MGIKLLVGLMELQTCLALAPVLPVWVVLKVLAQVLAGLLRERLALLAATLCRLR
jgi:hypothetical protein